MDTPALPPELCALVFTLCQRDRWLPALCSCARQYCQENEWRRVTYNSNLYQFLYECVRKKRFQLAVMVLKRVGTAGARVDAICGSGWYTIFRKCMRGGHLELLQLLPLQQVPLQIVGTMTCSFPLAVARGHAHLVSWLLAELDKAGIESVGKNSVKAILTAGARQYCWRVAFTEDRYLRNKCKCLQDFTLPRISIYQASSFE